MTNHTNLIARLQGVDSLNPDDCWLSSHLYREAATALEELSQGEARLREALEVCDDAIREMFRYYDGGETRGSYDGKPERAQLRKAGYAARAAIMKEARHGN